jgi:hypothetical protein
MTKIVARLAVSVLVALVATIATFSVGEFVTASPSGGAGLGPSGTVSGFPIPYATFIPCCASGGGPQGYHSYNNTYFYQPLKFAADFAIWLAISLAVALTFSLPTLALAAAAGLGVTLLTLLLAPFSMVAPTPALETAVLKPMGFPYDYLTYYVSGLSPVGVRSGYEFALPPAMADYALWTGVCAALIGITMKMLPANYAGRPLLRRRTLHLKPKEILDGLTHPG